MTWLKKVLEFGPSNRLEAIIEKRLRASSRTPNQIKILDIGSGGAGYWNHILSRFGGQIELTLFDPMEPQNLQALSKLGNVKHMAGFAPGDLAQFDSNTFEICTAFDLIEHLSKEDGYRLLYEIDRVTLGTSILFTPSGFVWQAPSSNNPFNAHISGWQPMELRRLGWARQRGHTGIATFFGPYGAPKFETTLAKKLSLLTAILVRFAPSISFAFSGLRDHEPETTLVHSGVQRPPSQTTSHGL